MLWYLVVMVVRIILLINYKAKQLHDIIFEENQTDIIVQIELVSNDILDLGFEHLRNRKISIFLNRIKPY
jgi:hypothetical protein